MNDSIASKVLAIAKEKEEQKLILIKKRLFSLIRKAFREQLDSLAWDMREDIYFLPFTPKELKLTYSELKKLSNSFGFDFHSDPKTNATFLSVRKLKTGDKVTLAWVLHLRYTKLLHRRIRLEEERAEDYAKQMLNRLEHEEFLCFPYDEDGYRLHLVTGFVKITNPFKDTVLRILKENGFDHVEISEYSCEIILSKSC